MPRVLTKLALPFVAFVLLFSTSACSDDSNESSGVDLSDVTFEVRTDETNVQVDAIDNSFVPAYVEVRRGTTVTFENDGRNPHNVLPAEEGAFEPIEQDVFQPGDVGSITFDEAGDFPYYCSLHGTTTRGMVGAIRVVE